MSLTVPCIVYSSFVTPSRVAQDRWERFGAWLKEKREAGRFSQAGAAKRAGIDRQQWYRIETGKSGTKRETVIAIANALSLDVAETLNHAGFSAQDAPEPKTPVERLQAIEKLLPGFEGAIFFEGDDADAERILDAMEAIARIHKRFDKPKGEE
jgi:transcriptional regulator with XRE-family HTH domain